MNWLAQYWIEVLFAAIIAAFGSGLRWILNWTKKWNVKQEAVRQGVRALLHDRIIEKYRFYIEKGFCPVWERQGIDDLYNQYHALGGNGTVVDLMEKLAQLPTEERI